LNKTNTTFFDTIVIKADAKSKEITEENQINFFYDDQNTVSISLMKQQISDLNTIISVLLPARNSTTTIVYTTETNHFQKAFLLINFLTTRCFLINTIQKPL
jgi:glycine dehydrogenase